MINRDLLGQIIKQARKRNKLTQEELAEAVNLSPNYLSKIERGLNIPSADVFLQMIDVLNLELKDFGIYKDKNISGGRKHLEQILLKTNDKNLSIIIPVIEVMIEKLNNG